MRWHVIGRTHARGHGGRGGHAAHARRTCRHPVTVHFLKRLEHIGSEWIVLFPGLGTQLSISRLDVFLFHWNRPLRLQVYKDLSDDAIFFSSKPSSPLQRLGRLMRSYRCIAALKAAEASSSIVSYMLIKEKRWFCKWSPINQISIFPQGKNNRRKVSLFWLATILKWCSRRSPSLGRLLLARPVKWKCDQFSGSRFASKILLLCSFLMQSCALSQIIYSVSEATS